MQVSLDRDAFAQLAETSTVVPLSVELIADRLTPVSIFDRLVGNGDGFLLESVEGGERWARWSFVGWHPAFTVTARDGRTVADASWVEIPPGDPLTVLEALTARYSTPDDALLGFGGPVPPLHSGAVGFLAYDAVRYIEALPHRPPDDRSLPEMLWQFVGGLAAFDRLRDSVTLIWNVYVGDDPRREYDRAVTALAGAVDALREVGSTSVALRPAVDVEAVPATASMSRGAFEDAVGVAIDHIVAGDAFQIVPSIRFETTHGADPFSIYRALRLVNPSPYMFLVRSGDVSIVGSSPELMSRVRDGRAFSRPIAGTRPRGATDQEDLELERELLADPKERAEHVMLIDLARNDLGRVCEFGTVAVDDLMVIERYSHVMHIVSGVSGDLRPGVGPVDVLRATFPHGTVSGAPKVRAMEIIDELEPTARGPYAGAVGYIDFSGNLDTAIALRTCIVDGDTAWVQAGAGIVVDSDPSSEYEECVNKARAVLTAIAIARDLGSESVG
jgi:anthranilate synthase component 1